MKKQSMSSNFIYNVSYEVFRIIVPLITTPYISRVLGSDGIGVYTLAHTYSQYFVLFAGLGFSTYAARQLAYERDDEEQFRATFWEIFIVRFALNLIALIVYVPTFFIYNTGMDVSYRICILYLIATMFDVSYYFGAVENFKTLAIRNFVVKLLSLILIFIFVKRANQVWLYTLILAASELVGQALMIFQLDKGLFQKTKLNFHRFKYHFKNSLALFLPVLAIQVYGMLDKVMLGAITNESEVGYYENAQKLDRLASTIPSAIVSVSVPRIAYNYAKNKTEKIQEHIDKVFSLVSFLVFPMCFGLIGVASNFSSWFYGSNFEGIESLVVAGAVLIISLGWSGLFGNMILVATGNQKYYTLGVYIGAVLNICMNAVLIPRIGAMGAILASDAAELTGMFIMFYFCNKLYPIARNLKKSLKYLVGSLMMLAVIWVINRFVAYSIWTTVLEIGVGAAVYLLIMFVVRDPSLRYMLKYARKFPGRFLKGA